MMLSTIAEAASLMGRADWLEAALLNGEFLVNNLRDKNGEWKRSWHDSGSPKARHHALAADISHLVDAFTRLGEASGQAKWMLFAREAADNLLDNYWDNERGGVFTTPKTGETLIVRQKDVMDNATPSANSTAANALYGLVPFRAKKNTPTTPTAFCAFFHASRQAHQPHSAIFLMQFI
jgi:hypothetical protein